MELDGSLSPAERRAQLVQIREAARQRLRLARQEAERIRLAAEAARTRAEAIKRETEAYLAKRRRAP